MSASSPLIGSSPDRVDGRDKVTGAAIYVDDITPEGCLHGVTVRADVSCGTLDALRLDEDHDWTGVTVVTADDIPGRNVVALIEDDQPCLVPIGGDIRHAGEAIALVAAATRRAALRAAEHVHVTCTPRPAVTSLDEADTVFKTLRIEKGDVETAFAGCDHIVEATYTTGAQEQMYIEPQGMIARVDEHGVCRVEGSMQCPYYVHRALEVLLGCPEDAVAVRQAVTGGGFGGKEEFPSMLAGHAALLARKAGAPVKMIYGRGEDIAFTTKRHPARIRHRLGLDADGTLKALEVQADFDAGAYVTLSPVVLSRGVLHAAGPYRIPNVRVVGRMLATNHPPHGAFRGFGAPQTIFATERQVEKAARLVGLDPLELRRRNALDVGDETATGQVLEHSVGSREVLEAVTRAAGTALAENGETTVRGRGHAFLYHGAGFTGSGEDRLEGKASVALESDGTFVVRASSTDIGQGARTTFTQIAADALGVPADAVRIAEADTDAVPDSGPTVASRTCMVVGSVVEQAARALAARIRTDLGEADDADLVLCAGRHAGAEVTRTYASPPGIRWDDDTYRGSAYPVYGWAACLADVAVDLDTAEVTVERIVHAVDVGRAIHPVIVRGQIDGGTAQALGWALWEHVGYADGRVTNPSMTDCIIPTALEIPELETVLVEVPYPHGPGGAKGVGEIPMDGPGAAVVNAIANATGIEVDRLPCLPEILASRLAERTS